MDTDPARVSFLGAAMVLWCPLLEWLVDGRDLRWKSAPQTWMAAVLCLAGVGVLEGVVGTDAIALEHNIMTGDLLALVQAIGFGTQCFLCSKILQNRPDQVLPITAVLITTTSVLAWMWCSLDGASTSNNMVTANTFVALWHENPTVLYALLWTGLVSTSGCFTVEVAALGRVPSSEASVLLATEPIWAAVFASMWMGEALTASDYGGGALMITACLVNALVRPEHVQRLQALLPAANKKTSEWERANEDRRGVD